jgi:hypothetical protein
MRPPRRRSSHGVRRWMWPSWRSSHSVRGRMRPSRQSSHGVRGRMQPSRRRRRERQEDEWLEAREGEELRLAVLPLNLHGARPSCEVLETAAGDVLRRRGAGTPVETKGLAGARVMQGADEVLGRRWRQKGSPAHGRCRAPASSWDAGGGRRARRRTGDARRRRARADEVLGAAAGWRRS